MLALPPARSAFIASLAFLSLGTCALNAQELRHHATPFSVWLDFHALAASGTVHGALPIWLQSVQGHYVPAPAGKPGTTLFRLSFRRLSDLNRNIQLRLFFDDQQGHAPSVTGWTETGELRFEARSLGMGLGLPTSEALLVSMRDVDYLEIESPGDGGNLRGAFVTTLKEVSTHQALDFAAPADMEDPFENLAPARPEREDAYLYGRVKATLEVGPVKLGPTAPVVTFDFELDARPLMAVVAFEILDVDPVYPPDITVNQRPLGAVALHVPDLADPGYEGTVRPLDRDMRFRYAGWLRCQKVIYGTALDAGLNKLVLQLNSHSGPVAIRAVEIQLKHNWQNLDYKLVP